MSTTAVRRVAIGLALALAAGCRDDPVAPPDHVGHYALRAVDGDDLPVVLETTPARTLIGASVELYEDGTGFVMRVESTEDEETPGPTTTTHSITWDVDEQGTFVAQLPCPAEGPCTVAPHMIGRFIGTGLQLTHYWIPGHEWTFVRQHVLEVGN